MQRMLSANDTDPNSTKIAAVTHVRNDDYFLGLWVKHYGRLIGRENCFVILDGDDWSPVPDLSGVNVIVLPRPRSTMHRVRIDRRMQSEQLNLITRIFEELNYDYVIKGDCDEYVVPDPLEQVSIQQAVREADIVGAVYSSGVNVFHDSGLEPRLDQMQDPMSQRHLAMLSQSYCKVNVLARAGYRAGIRTNPGGHRVATALPVHVSQKFYMIHLGWCDVPMWQERAAHRIAFDRDDSFLAYVQSCSEFFDRVSRESDSASDFDRSLISARQELCYRKGNRATKPNKFRRGNFRYEEANDYLVRLDSRFHGSVG
jgi:hypothetical protein